MADLMRSELGEVSFRMPLPKPPRVEKWQRWRDSRGAIYVMSEPVESHGRWRMRREGRHGDWFGENMLSLAEWHFLGYAKPDKIEVGQRWRERDVIYTVVEVAANGAAIFGDRSRIGADGLLKGDAWEYVGMANRHVNDNRRTAPIVRFEAHIISDENLAAINEFCDAAAKTLDVLATREQLARGVLSLLTQWFAWARDPRVQNKVAARRLIANPPEWAYPRAWTCAVLSVQECLSMSGASFEAIDKKTMAVICKIAHERKPAPVGCAIDPTWRAAFNAYARGMEKPAGLRQRPGVMRVR